MISRSNDEEISRNKLTRFRCNELPLSLWNQDCFGEIVVVIEMLMSMDEATTSWEVWKYARLKVWISIRLSTIVNKDMKINYHVYSVTLEEEILVSIIMMQLQLW